MLLDVAHCVLRLSEGAVLRARIDAALTDVAPCQQVRKFVVLPRPFTVAAGELTVSLKLRRNVVLAKYEAELAALYQER